MIATTRETRDKVAAIICSHGAHADTAELILSDLAGAGIHLVEVEPPPVPYTGEKAAEPSARIKELKAIVRGATKPTEYEETES